MGCLHRIIRISGALLLLVATLAGAARISDVAGTRHNLSASGEGTVRATTEDEVCVFCHTPHGASSFPGSPLWNRQLSDQTYTVYTSTSLDAEDIMGQLDQPGGSSKLCLSCHDGTLAIGMVNVLDGQQDVTIQMTGTAADGSMPAGAGQSTGFTRDLGIDLRNDHPISLNYDSQLATLDSELVDPVAAAHIGVRAPGIRPQVPLEDTGAGASPQVQCATCHDPHIRDTDPAEVIKFLRLNRFQQTPPVGGTFDASSDIMCLACHDKEGWESSAHALPTTADETYTASAAAQREFPAALPVWQAACLNCHDTHSVHGSRRLLREGTDSLAIPRSGGESAIEETCFQCHAALSAVTNVGGDVKDIKTDFSLPRHMPLTSVDQPAGVEVHDITDADLSESQLLLGRGDLNNRHAECTDCHNPHRVMKNALFNATGTDTQPTHEHAAGHSNIASGALRGAWGVEPIYGSAAFPDQPTTYQVKQGDGGLGASTDVNSTWVTREYQICLKCHSDFGYTDTNSFPTGSRPNLDSAGGGTPSGTNGLTQYTNQAVEFQAPLFHKGEVTTGDSGAGSAYSSNNHRSWHPVIDDTGRTPAVRSASAAAWLAPWDSNVGNQTMYCSDCHGSNTLPTSVEPSGNNPWGPHGSTNDFILKGTWDDQTGGQTREVPPTDPDNGLCFKCHDYQTYADRNGDDLDSGFSGSRSNNLHAFHADRIERMHCMWCHVAVPHGWKNKALLVNLNDVGPEAGLASGTEVAIGGSLDVLNQEPYYFNAKLKVNTFATSGNWEETNCGSAGTSLPGNDTQTGRDWMRTVCETPP
ncbi:MAG: cytochrome c3 family protein [Thiohalobacterales bacterium]|nr:cytochrome c3 family protein [Thiohalobacterales bacterium]